MSLVPETGGQGRPQVKVLWVRPGRLGREWEHLEDNGQGPLTSGLGCVTIIWG